MATTAPPPAPRRTARTKRLTPPFDSACSEPPRARRCLFPKKAEDKPTTPATTDYQQLWLQLLTATTKRDDDLFARELDKIDQYDAALLEKLRLALVLVIERHLPLPPKRQADRDRIYVAIPHQMRIDLEDYERLLECTCGECPCECVQDE